MLSVCFRGDADVRLAILIITIATGVFQWIFLVVVAREITAILGISVFLTKQTVERRKQRREVSNGLNVSSHDLEESLLA